MTPLATLEEQWRGDVAVARVAGEIDASNAPWLAERLSGFVSNQSLELAVDLTDTTYLDSAGIAVLFDLATAMTRHRQQLRLVVADRSPIGRMVTLTGLDAAIPTYPTVDAALAAR
jgi:anti-sigma B factor antagonist